MVYKLIKIEKSSIKGRRVTDKEYIGGVKLTYKCTKTEDIVIFLKPLKVLWANDKKECKPGEWGNTMSPLSAVWVKLNKNYENWYTDYMLIRTEQLDSNKDCSLIASLNKEEPFILLGLSPRKISTLNKIKFACGNLVDLFKNNLKFN